jgi:flagellar biosynthesis protein FlhB
MAEDKDQKTEEASQKKLEDARRKGQVALSRDVVNWGMFRNSRRRSRGAWR